MVACGLPGKIRYTATFQVLLGNSQKYPLHDPLRSGLKRYEGEQEHDGKGHPPEKASQPHYR